MLTYLILGAGLVVLLTCAAIAFEVREKPPGGADYEDRDERDE